MERNNSLPNLVPDQRTGGVSEQTKHSDALAQQSDFAETCPSEPSIAEGAETDKCSLMRSYSSASSSNTADTSATLSTDQRSSTSMQWPLKDMPSSGSVSSLGSSVSLSRSELPSLTRLDKTLLQSIESCSRLPAGASTATNSLEKQGSLVLAGNGSAGRGIAGLTSSTEEQRDQPKHEQQARVLRDTAACAYMEPGARKCVNGGGLNSRDFTSGKSEKQNPVSESNWRASRTDFEKMDTTGARSSPSWRSPAKVENTAPLSDSAWRASRNETSGRKKPADRKDSSSFFATQIKKAIANIASLRAGPTETDRTKNSDADSSGLKHFAAEVSALLAARPTGADSNGFSNYAGRSSTQAPAAGSQSPAPDTSQNTCGSCFLLPPDAGVQDYIRRPTSAPPTLSKFSASTLLGFPTYDSSDSASAELTRDELCHQIWRKLCQTLPARPSSREKKFDTQKSTKVSEGDNALTAAAAAAAAALLQEQQGKWKELPRGQQTVLASEQHRRNEQRQLAAAALKLAGSKQLQRPMNGVNKGNHDDCVSLAVAAVAAALLRESQPSWRDDKNQVQMLPTETRPGSSVNLQAPSASTAGEGPSPTMPMSPAAASDALKDTDQRRLPSSLLSDSTRGSKSPQPTSLAAPGAPAIKSGKQDFAVSLSVPHSPVGLSSLLSSPCSSKTPTLLSRRPGDCSLRPNGRNLLEATVTESGGCIGSSPPDRPREPRLLHEHHRLLLSLPKESDADSELLKGGHSLGTTPHITVVKIDGEKQNNNTDSNKERRLSALDKAARALVSAAAKSNAELLLQQLENEEREVFRCASAPPGEGAASLLYPADFMPLPPTVQADTHRGGTPQKGHSSAPEGHAAGRSSRERSSSKPYPESTQHPQVPQNTPAAPAPEQEQSNSVSIAEEKDVAATSTGELSNKGYSALPSTATVPSEPTTHQVGSTPMWTEGSNASEPQQQQRHSECAPQVETNDAVYGRSPFTGARFPLNSWVDAPALVGGGGAVYPLLYNSTSMIPGRQVRHPPNVKELWLRAHRSSKGGAESGVSGWVYRLCLPAAPIAGCWEEDHAAFLVTRRAADVAGAMAAYGPSAPHSGVHMGPPPMVIPLGASVAAEIQHQAMRAAAGAFLLQQQSAAAAAAAAAANRGDSNEWARPAVTQTLGRGTGGGLFYGGSGACCGVGGVDVGNGYSSVGRYFPEDPLAAAATFAAVDPYNWARVNGFSGGPLGYQDGQPFAGESAGFSVAHPGGGIEDLSKLQQLQQAPPTWATTASENPENTCGDGDRRGPKVSRSNSSLTLASANREEQQAGESCSKGDKRVDQPLDKALSSSEDRPSRGEWTTPSYGWSSDRPAETDYGTTPVRASSSEGRESRSGPARDLGEDVEDFRLQKGTEPTITRAGVKGHVATWARDQVGCRMLQRLLGEGGEPEDVQIIYEELLEDGAELMLDPFGNYLVQKLLEVVSEDQFRTYLARASPRLVKACLSTHGTRSVQKIVEVIAKQADPRPSLKIFVEAVEPALPALVRDSSANHVIQKALSTLPSSYCDFIFSHVEAHCVAICKERHGCCVIQRCIDAVDKGKKRRLLAIIIRNAVELVQDSFGNYVVQYVLDIRIPAVTEGIMASLKGKIYSLSKQKFSSNVVEKCLVHGTPSQVRDIIDELLEGGADLFRDLLLDQFGNYVVQRALSVSQPSGQEMLLRAISPCLPYLRRTSAGGCVAHRLVKRYPSLDSSSNPVHCSCTVPVRAAPSPAHTEGTRAKYSTPVVVCATAVAECEDRPDKPTQHSPSSHRAASHHSKSKTAVTRATRSGTQNRTTEDRAEEKNYSTPQAVLKKHKKATQHRNTGVQSSSRRRAPDSCTTTWAPVSRAQGTPAESHNGEVKPVSVFATEHDNVKGTRGRTGSWVDGGTVEIGSGGCSSSSCGGRPSADVKPVDSREGERSARGSSTSPSCVTASKTHEMGGQNTASWHLGEAKRRIMLTQGHKLSEGSTAGSTTTTAVPRSGRNPSTRRHNKHRPVKPLHVS